MTLEELTTALQKDDFAIKKKATHLYGYNVWLECGFVLAVYHSGKSWFRVSLTAIGARNLWNS